jgi:hypothetical protein
METQQERLFSNHAHEADANHAQADDNDPLGCSDRHGGGGGGGTLSVCTGTKTNQQLVDVKLGMSEQAEDRYRW